MKTLIIFALLFLQSISVSALYFDFEDDAQLGQWDSLGTWQIIRDNDRGSKVLSGEGANEVCTLIGEENWTDYTIEFEASGQTDEISVAFRAKDANTYIGFMIAPSLNLTEFFQKLNGAFDEGIAAKADSLGVKIQVWHKYRLEVEGNTATAYVDDKKALNPLDLGKLPKDFAMGRVGFRQWADKAYYDNVLITGPDIPRSPGENAVSPMRKLSATWGSIK